MALAATLATAMVATLGLVAFRGAWLDEAYSVWFAGHDVSFHDALVFRWLRDGHPPLYYAYSWLLQPWLGESLGRFRLINLGGLLVGAATALHLGRRGDGARFLLPFALLVAANPFFLLYAAELRSYFLQLVLCACLLAQLRPLLLGERPELLHWALLATTAVLLVNLHYVGSLVAFALLGLAALILARQRRWRAAGALVGIACVGAALLTAAVATFLLRTSPTPTNATPPVRALAFIAATLLAGVIANPPAALAAIPRLYRAARSRNVDGFACWYCWRCRRSPSSTSATTLPSTTWSCDF